MFPNRSCLWFEINDGKEILIHIGMDTVELDGKGFDVKVQAGQR